MTARTYLSIGDVLTLLREEFPDITISKIRFLESQGLVNPERSPSGYRKFFETDVERLRWVLRQQREHFLPLKVIRDRLADGDLGEEDERRRPRRRRPWRRRLSRSRRNGLPRAGACCDGRVPAAGAPAGGPRGHGAADSGTGTGTGTVTAARSVARPVAGAVPGRRSGDGADSGRRISPYYPGSRGRRPAALAPRHPRPFGARPSGRTRPRRGERCRRRADAADAGRRAARQPDRRRGRGAGCPDSDSAGAALRPLLHRRPRPPLGPCRPRPRRRHVPATTRAPPRRIRAPGDGGRTRPHPAPVRAGAPVEHATRPGGGARAGGPGTGGRAAAGAGRQGATAPRAAAEPGAAAPREKGAGGASGKSAGGQSAKSGGAGVPAGGRRRQLTADQRRAAAAGAAAASAAERWSPGRA